MNARLPEAMVTSFTSAVASSRGQAARYSLHAIAITGRRGPAPPCLRGPAWPCQVGDSGDWQGSRAPTTGGRPPVHGTASLVVSLSPAPLPAPLVGSTRAGTRGTAPAGVEAGAATRCRYSAS